MWEYMDTYLNWGMSGIDIHENVVMAPKLVDQLNMFGQKGWELVNLRMTGNQGNGVATFKRRLDKRSDQ